MERNTTNSTQLQGLTLGYNIPSMTQDQPRETSYRWYILILGALTNVLVVAAPSMCMPVLFEEISKELNLSLVQVGLVWGISALPGIFTVLLGGAIGDRFGPKRVLIAACFLVGLTGALRGLSNSFTTLSISMFALGLFIPFITMNTMKTCGLYFSSRQLGFASGILSMGMALGFLIGSLFSATVLSPWLGGWRQVLFLYGGIGMLLTIPWLLTRSFPQPVRTIGDEVRPKTVRQIIWHIARIRNIWMFGLAIFGIGGSIQGVLGYIPLYLRGLGWAEASADGALAAFHTISLLFVIPIALASDRLGTRKKILLAAGLMILTGFGLAFVCTGSPGLDRGLPGRHGARWIHGRFYDLDHGDRRGRAWLCRHGDRDGDDLWRHRKPGRPSFGQQPGRYRSGFPLHFLGST